MTRDKSRACFDIMRHVFSCITVIALNMSQGYAQEATGDDEEPGKHRVTFGLGHTHLSKGKDIDGETVWLPVPSWSLNYDFKVTPKWAIGLQTDLVMEKFVVEDNDNEDLERERPLSVVAVGLFKVGKHFNLIGGGGVEFEKEKNLGMTRLGVEYGIEITNGWEAGGAVLWDAKWGSYDSWGLEFTFSKSFPSGRRG